MKQLIDIKIEVNMFKNKKVVIFDLDGTLIDSIGIWNKVDEIMISKISNNTVKIDNIGKVRDDLLKQFKSGDIYLEYVRFLKEKCNSDMKAEDILKLRLNISTEYIENEIDYKIDADKVLHKLKEKGYILALATTTSNIQLDIYKNKNRNIINKANLEDTFSMILSKDDVIEKKPNPEVHYKIMEKLNVKPEECIIIEDSLIGMQAAKNANIQVISMYDKYADLDRQEINLLADYKVDNFTEILNNI